MTAPMQVRVLTICGLAVVCAAGIMPGISSAQCVTPLTDPKSNQPSDWSDLLQWHPTTTAEGMIRLLTIEGGTEPVINLDYYAVTFARHPTFPMARVFKDIRLRFDQFAHGKQFASDEDRETHFLPYRASTAGGDRVQLHNRDLWRSERPLGALMSFVLDSHPPVFAAATLSGVRPVKEQGDVVVTCAEATAFVFSTAYTVKNTEHPVSGHRGFGIKDNGNGTWTFYTKGADRQTAAQEGPRSGLLYFGVHMARIMRPAPGMRYDEDAVFRLGHEFWMVFFERISDYLEQRGMKVNREPLVKNTKRYPYPTQ